MAIVHVYMGITDKDTRDISNDWVLGTVGSMHTGPIATVRNRVSSGRIARQLLKILIIIQPFVWCWATVGQCKKQQRVVFSLFRLLPLRTYMVPNIIRKSECTAQTHDFGNFDILDVARVGTFWWGGFHNPKCPIEDVHFHHRPGNCNV